MRSASTFSPWATASGSVTWCRLQSPERSNQREWKTPRSPMGVEVIRSAKLLRVMMGKIARKNSSSCWVRAASSQKVSPEKPRTVRGLAGMARMRDPLASTASFLLPASRGESTRRRKAGGWWSMTRCRYSRCCRTFSMFSRACRSEAEKRIWLCRVVSAWATASMVSTKLLPVCLDQLPILYRDRSASQRTW